MLFKLIFLIIIVFSLKPPLNSILDILILVFLFIALIFTKKLILKDILIKKNYIILSLLFSSISFLIPNNFYEEGHQIFINEKDLKIIEEFVPNSFYINMKSDFINRFDFQRLYKSHDNGKGWFEESNFIENPIAFSVDNFFYKSKYSRYVQSINFDSREKLRIGQINKLNYNLVYDKELRRSLPYYVFFNIPPIAKNSDICINKVFYYKFIEEKIKIDTFKNIKFNKSDPGCLPLSNNKNLFIFSHSINLEDNLEIKLKENILIKLLKIIKYILSISSICIFLFIYFEKKFYINALVYIISIFSTFILFAIRDVNILNGIRYYRGGADGLLHYSYGRDIVESIFNKNYFDAIMGMETVFYFMPGLRYFSALSNIIFGENSYGYILICSFIPLIIYKIFELLINKRWSTILFISFIFIPIFENMGFGYFNYVWQVARYHAETLAILFILICLYLVIIKQKNVPGFEIYFYFTSIFLSLAVFLRPNFFPTSLILFFYLVFLFYKNKNFKLLFFNLFGYSLIFLSLIHNYYFGSKIVFFTDAGVNFTMTVPMIFNGIYSFFLLDFQDQNLILLKSQFLDWNPFYNIHRIFILLFIFITLISRKHNAFAYIIFTCMVSQHFVLFLTYTSSRYAYLAWLLTFILFFYLISQYNLKIFRRNAS